MKMKCPLSLSIYQNGSLVTSDTTDERGFFKIIVDNGSYNLIANDLGVTVYEKEINVSSSLDLGTIKTESTIQLEAANITAKPPKLKKELGKYSIKNISSSPFAKGKTAMEFLKYVPIINTDNEGNSLKILMQEFN